MRLLLTATFAVLLPTASFSAPRTPEIQATAPIKNFRLPTFDTEGYRTMYLKAGTASIVSAAHIDVTNMTFTLFADDRSGSVDTQFTSPAASLLVDQQIIKGDSTLHVVRRDFDLTGSDWRYLQTEKKILINRDARIVFNAQLFDLLK